MTEFAHQFFTDPEDREKSNAASVQAALDALNGFGQMRLAHAHVFTIKEPLVPTRGVEDKYSMVAYINRSIFMQNIAHIKQSDGKVSVIFTDDTTGFKKAIICLFSNILAFQRFAADAGLAVHLSPNAVRKYIAA